MLLIKQKRIIHVLQLCLHCKLASCLCVRVDWILYVQQSATVIASMEDALPRKIALVILLGLETCVTMVIYIHTYIYIYIYIN